MRSRHEKRRGTGFGVEALVGCALFGFEALREGMFGVAGGIAALGALIALMVWVPELLVGSLDPWGWRSLERETGRSARRYLRESTTTVPRLATRRSESRITNHLPPRPDELVGVGE